MFHGIVSLVLLNIAQLFIFPFGYESNIELFNLYDIDLPSLLEMLPSYDLVSKLSNMPNLNKSDLDENFIHTINSKYHSVSDLIRLNKMSTDFSLFHVILEAYLNTLMNFTH